MNTALKGLEEIPLPSVTGEGDVTKGNGKEPVALPTIPGLPGGPTCDPLTDPFCPRVGGTPGGNPGVTRAATPEATRAATPVAAVADYCPAYHPSETDPHRFMTPPPAGRPVPAGGGVFIPGSPRRDGTDTPVVRQDASS